MYKPKGKTPKVLLEGGEQAIPESNYVQPSSYDNILRDLNVYNIRTTQKIYNYIPEPTETSYLDRTIERYFVQHKSSGEVLEVAIDVYRSLLNKETKYHYPSYLTGATPWRLRGPVANQEINGYIVAGAQSDNEFFISQLELTLPNIRTYLTDPTQFVK